MKARSTGTRASGRTTCNLITISARVEGGMIVHPVRRRALAVGELGGVHLAHDDGTGIDEALDDQSVFFGWRVQMIPGAVAVGGSQAFHVEDVFHADAHTR